MALTGAERVERHRQKQRARIEELESENAALRAQIEEPESSRGGLYPVAVVLKAVGITEKRFKALCKKDSVTPTVTIEGVSFFHCRALSVLFIKSKVEMESMLNAAAIELANAGLAG